MPFSQYLMLQVRISYVLKEFTENTIPVGVTVITSAEEGGYVLVRSVCLFVCVTKVTFHPPPTATHFLGEWTLPSRALVLCSSDVPDEVIQ